MANNKWSGIESRKYNITARWYVSAYYGNDNDIDGADFYDASTNPTGHGGPTRPFATLDKLEQTTEVVNSCGIVIDSGFYHVPQTTTKRYKL